MHTFPGLNFTIHHFNLSVYRKRNLPIKNIIKTKSHLTHTHTHTIQSTNEDKQGFYSNKIYNIYYILYGLKTIVTTFSNVKIYFFLITNSRFFKNTVKIRNILT